MIEIIQILYTYTPIELRVIILWLYDGYKIDQEKRQEELTKSFNRNNDR
jgi:hypothetical protein